MPYWDIVFTVGLVVLFVIVYKIGVYEGKLVEWKRKKSEISYYPETSQPTQRSGTPEPERGSDDTE